MVSGPNNTNPTSKFKFYVGMNRMLASNQYYSNKVEQHKTHIDKLYTTTEWLVMEKRRINNEMDEIAESYVKHNEFDEYKQY